ncbi:tetrathionate reductase family octaheme c-type cytochrome [Roseospirillum parvum]|uniref:Octaheme c-type cytochrome, tetrathionate reductase family n=1 Tax=Roseospirillum parvum TaxID=83401 RepID=A0A1G8DIN7_9PROT|nr:tetrathionate reductase family octaheme c-type cytochrome [Roseospirillum parvum]SDH57461.1 octaheme c-type cytochrome, tetrathionate reductase family [Roseospirillum parvum]
MPRPGLLILAFCLLAAPALATQAAETPSPDAPTPRLDSTADHTKFKELKGDFKNGPEVTRACLECHTEAAAQLKATTHWSWTFHGGGEDAQTLGKRHVINSFCGSALSNEPRCTSCHIGYDWTDLRQSPDQQGVAVDCLVCHDTTGAYVKHPELAGHPDYAPASGSPPDLGHIARHVGASGRANCGACHFHGGGGDGVKHGDLDSSLIDPGPSLDIHMAKEGGDFTCATCHNPRGHQVPGSRYQTQAAGEPADPLPSRQYQSHARCESCHGGAPHPDLSLTHIKLNGHVDRVACQTCHIPTFARGGVATKTWWDWSTAGRLGPDGKPLKIKDDHGHFSYLSTKGDFRYAEDVVPTYRWFDGTLRYSLADETIDPAAGVEINHVRGDRRDAHSRIWPFKVMRGRQPYDKVHNTLLVNHVFGDDDSALWTNFDWPKALAAGTTYAGQPYSGQFGFVDTTMAWPITHMVAPADDALQCAQCHARDGRLAELSGFYMPGRDGFGWIDFLGYAALVGALLGVAVHAALRIIWKGRARR